MKRSQLKIGQKVLVIPPHTNKDEPAPKPVQMYVQELNKGLLAGLSYRKHMKGGIKAKHIYGILYSVIHPFPARLEKNGTHPGTTVVKLEFEVKNELFEKFAEYLQGIKQFTVKK